MSSPSNNNRNASNVNPSPEEDLALFFQQTLGLLPSQQEAALRCCQDQLVLSVGDLRAVAGYPEDVKDLFPHVGVRCRVKEWFQKEQRAKLLGGDGDDEEAINNTNGATNVEGEEDEVKTREETIKGDTPGTLVVVASAEQEEDPAASSLSSEVVDKPMVQPPPAIVGSTKKSPLARKRSRGRSRSPPPERKDHEEGKERNSNSKTEQEEERNSSSKTTEEIPPLTAITSTTTSSATINTTAAKTNRSQKSSSNGSSNTNGGSSGKPTSKQLLPKEEDERNSKSNTTKETLPPPTTTTSTATTAKQPSKSSSKTSNSSNSSINGEPTAKQLLPFIKRGLDQHCLDKLEGISFLDPILPNDISPHKLVDTGGLAILEPTSHFQTFLKAVAQDMALDDKKYGSPSECLELLHNFVTDWIQVIQKSTSVGLVKEVDLQTSTETVAPQNSQTPSLARRKFEEWRDNLLESLPSSNRQMFGSVGFCKWGKQYRPAMVVSPFGVPPLGMRDEYLKVYESLQKKDSLHSMGHLIWWIGPDLQKRSRAYSVISRDGFLGYEEGCQKGCHELPKTFQSLIDKRKPLAEKQRDLAGSLTMLRHLAKQESDQRSHPWSDFQEKEWWWWGNGASEEGEEEEEEEEEEEKVVPKHQKYFIKRQTKANNNKSFATKRGNGVKKDTATAPRVKKRRTLG